jgi:hypothetical protein
MEEDGALSLVQRFLESECRSAAKELVQVYNSYMSSSCMYHVADAYENWEFDESL